MTLDEAIRRNPYNLKKGNEAAYCRYLRYNVEGWYQLDSKKVRRRWQKVRNMDKEFSADFEKDILDLAEKYFKNQTDHITVSLDYDNAVLDIDMTFRAYKKR